MGLKSGFYQIPVRMEHRHKTAFITPTGLYEFLSMPFGLINAPLTFQRIMDKVLPLKKRGVRVYIDDIIIYTRDMDEHVSLLGDTLKRLIDSIST